jgi:hypothetical protein
MGTRFLSTSGAGPYSYRLRGKLVEARRKFLKGVNGLSDEIENFKGPLETGTLVQLGLNTMRLGLFRRLRRLGKDERGSRMSAIGVKRTSNRRADRHHRGGRYRAQKVKLCDDGHIEFAQ